MLPPAGTISCNPSLAPGTGPLRILVVEDNVDAARLLAILLRTRAYQVSVAHDGASALAAARQERPDVMLVDLGLPDLSGYELARLVRSDNSLASVYLVALTGYGEARARARTAECGFDRHLVKPVDRAELEALLACCPTPSNAPMEPAAVGSSALSSNETTRAQPHME